MFKDLKKYLSIIITVIVLIIAILYINKHDLFSIIKNLSLLNFTLCLSIYFLFNFLNTLQISILLKRKDRLFDFFIINQFSSLGNLITPFRAASLGIRAIYFKNFFNIPVSKTIITFLATTLILCIASILILSINTLEIQLLNKTYILYLLTFITGSIFIIRFLKNRIPIIKDLTDTLTIKSLIICSLISIIQIYILAFSILLLANNFNLFTLPMSTSSAMISIGNLISIFSITKQIKKTCFTTNL